LAAPAWTRRFPSLRTQAPLSDRRAHRQVSPLFHSPAARSWKPVQPRRAGSLRSRREPRTPSDRPSPEQARSAPAGEHRGGRPLPRRARASGSTPARRGAANHRPAAPRRPPPAAAPGLAEGTGRVTLRTSSGQRPAARACLIVSGFVYDARDLPHQEW